MLLQRANVYRLEPTETQAVAFGQWVGACRFVYNLALDHRAFALPGRFFDWHRQKADLTSLRAEVDWLRAVPVHALQMAIKAVDGNENASSAALRLLILRPDPGHDAEKEHPLR